MSPVDIVVTWNRNSFCIFSRHHHIMNDIAQFGELYRQPTMKKVSRRPPWMQAAMEEEKGDEFFIYNKDNDSYTFIKDAWPSMVQRLGNLSRTGKSWTIQEIPFREFEGDDVVFDNYGFKLKEPEDSTFSYQNGIVEFTTDADRDHSILEVQTGKGKTAMAMKTIVLMSKRTLLITKAGYLDKWIDDVTGTDKGLGLKPGEIIRAKSASQLDAVFMAGRDNELGAGDGRKHTVKLIMVSSHTFDKWIRDYLSHEGFNPSEFCKNCGIGLTLYDETHQLFRMNYWSYLFINSKKVLDLSATLVPDKEDIFINDRYNERLPLEARYDKLEFDKYIDAFSIYYNIADKKLLQKINRLSMYNHTEFEKAIMAKNKYLNAYFDMIYDIMGTWYFNNYKDGQKCLVFFSTKQMCTDFTAYVKQKRPSFKVQRYIEGDKYADFLAADISISTPGKAGTAVDVVGLVTSIVTPAISKRQLNLQIIGRTRKDFTWGITPRAVFLHCRNLRKHVDYLNKRIEIFDGKVNKFEVLNSRFVI